MSTQTVTRAAETDLEPNEIYDVLADGRNISRWAPVFADDVERVDETHYNVTKGSAHFSLEVIPHRSAGTVDYVREMAGNKRGGAYIRVTPRPLAGSSITMTVPVGVDTSESDIGRTVEQELAELIRLARLRMAKV